jgi:hypothetical protein
LLARENESRRRCLNPAAAFSLSGAISFERVRQKNAGTQKAKRCHYGLNHRNHLAEYSGMRRQAQPHSQRKCYARNPLPTMWCFLVTVNALLAGGQLDRDVGRGADSPWSTVGEAAAVGLQDRFQNQNEFLGQHDPTLLFDRDL